MGSFEMANLLKQLAGLSLWSQKSGHEVGNGNKLYCIHDTSEI